MNRPDIYIHPSVGIIRSVMAVIDDLDHCLNQAKETEAYIHHIRVDIKRLRAWIRLVRNQSGKHDWQLIDHYLRDTAKQLSANRDEQIIPATLKWLKGKTKNRDAAARIDRVVSYIKSGSTGHPFDWKMINEMDKNLLEILKRKTLSSYSDAAVRKGLRRTYKRTMKLGTKAFSADATFDALHRFRKWVKYLCYQLEFAEILYADDFKEAHHQLDKLGKQLGKIHDLVLVRNRLKSLSRAVKYKNNAGIADMLAEMQINKLIKRTRHSFEKIFILKPGEFVTGMR